MIAEISLPTTSPSRLTEFSVITGLTVTNSQKHYGLQRKMRKDNITDRLADETVWLTLNQMADLLDKDKCVISNHIKKKFQDEELDREAVVAKNATTATDGKTRK